LGKKYPNWYPNSRKEFVKRALNCIDSGKASVYTIQDITGNISDLFTDYIKSLGYDGLMTIEGGEGSHLPRGAGHLRPSEIDALGGLPEYPDLHSSLCL